MDEENAPIPGPSGLAGKTKKANAAKKTKQASKSPESSEETNSKKTILDLVCEAIEAVGTDRKGASAQAIRNYVQSRKTESAAARINALVKRAFVKGIEKGILSRPTANKDATGATGHFILVKKVAKPKKTKTLVAKEHDTEQDESDSETTNENKLNLSYTVTKEVEHKTSTPKLTKNKRAASSKDPKGTKKPPVKKRVPIDRKDASDTEIVVKKGRKSVKSYSSDTEVDFVQKNVNSRSRKNANTVKSNAEKSEPLSKTSKAKGTRKLYNSSEDNVEKEKTSMKTRKVKEKKGK